MDGLTAIDLFAGAGGATQGLVDAGFSVLAAVENDPSAVASYILNHGQVKIEARDIAGVQVAALRRSLKIDRGQLTLLKSCPPCQGFSTLGARDPEDPRNDLVRETWRFVEEFEPRAVLVENVPGLRTDKRFSDLVTAAKDSGYWTISALVNAADFGVPQHRSRLIMLAIKEPTSTNWSTLTELLPSTFRTTPPTAGAAIALAEATSGDPIHRARTPRPATLERIRAVPVGGSRVDLPKIHQLACHAKLGVSAATSSYGRIRADEISPTMTTRCTTPSCGRFIHPTEDRGLTLREAALLQTFPPDYKFSGGHDQIERQIGNAVPVRMAHALGLVVRQLIQSGAQHQGAFHEGV